MKAALVTRRYPPLIGGAEKVLSYLAPALAKQGADVTVVTSSIEESVVADTKSLVPIVRLPTSRLRFIGTSIYMRSLERWLTSHRPEIIYVSMLKHDAYVAVKVGKRLGIPVVLRPEGAGATGDLAWQKWGRFGGRIGKLCKEADAFVAISPAVRAELLAEGYEESKIHDLPNGVPVPDQPWESPITNHAVFVGRLAPEKNLATLLDAWAIVLKTYPSAILKLVGDGPERAKMESIAPGSARFLGTTDDPSPILRSSDLFILPSHEEGMSIALLEAMALGMPIVASDIPGNRRLITDGIHGRLASPHSAEALADAINAQFANQSEAARMGREARARVVELYSIDAVARRHLDLFDRLIREARPC